MITIKTFSGQPFKSFLGGVDLYRIPDQPNVNKLEMHTDIRNVLGNALYRMEDLGVGYTSVYVHRRLVNEKAQLWDDTLINERHILRFNEFRG